MALIGNISGSADTDFQIYMTGTVIVGRPPSVASNQHLPDASEVAPDAVLFVSGAIGGRGDSGPDSGTGIGVSVFGGDTYISGALVVENYDVNGGSISGSIHQTTDGLSYLVAGTNMTITSASNGQVTFVAAGGGGSADAVGWSGPANTFIATTGSLNIGTTSATPGDADIFLSSSGGAVFNEQGASVDFRVESNNKTHAIFVEGSDDLVLILSGGAATSVDPSNATDMNFYVSGAIGSKGYSDSTGTAVFGGDTCVSGALYAGSMFTGDLNGAPALDVDSTTFTLDTTSTFSIDGVGASNVTTNGELTLSGSVGVKVHTTDGNIVLSGSAVDVDASGATSIDGASGINIGTAADVAIDIDSAALDIDASGAITIDGTSTFSVDAVGASNVTTKGALTLSGSSGVNIHSTGGTLVASGTAVNIDASSTVDIDGAGGINIGKAADVAFDIDTAALDIDSSGAITIDGTSTFSIDAVGASNITTNGALTLSGSTGISIHSTGGTLVASGTQVDVDASGAIAITSSGGGIDVDAAGTTSIDGASGINIGTAADVAIDIDSSTLDIDASGAITIDGGSSFSVDAVGTSNITTNGMLTVSGSTGVMLSAGHGTMVVTGSAISVASSETFISGSSGLTLVSESGDITLKPGGGDVLPDGDATRNLGSASKRWANIYTGDLHLQNERGNWTMIEEPSYLSLRNNATGKVYRILMEEVTD